MIEVSELDAVLRDCLFADEEVSDNTPPPDAVLVEGVVNKFGFHPQRLESHRAQVRTWLAELPHNFRESEGGGWSFLNACLLEDGTLWTGEHRRMEQLFALGIGLGMVRSVLPRDLWGTLPGGMPYYVITIDGESEQT